MNILVTHDIHGIVSNILIHQDYIVTAIDVTPTQHDILIYTNNIDNTLLQPVVTLRGHTYFITSLYVVGNLLYTNARDNSLLIYDLKSFEKVKDNKYVSSGYRDMLATEGRMFTVHSKYPTIVQITLL